MVNTNMKLAKLYEISVGGKGTYGIAASAVDRCENLYTYLRITDICDDGTLNRSGLKSVDDPDAAKYILKPNDIVFARTGGSTGRNYFYDGSDGEFVYAGFLIKFSIDPEKVNPKYIKYYCQSSQYKNWVHLTPAVHEAISTLRPSETWRYHYQNGRSKIFLLMCFLQ